MNIKRFQQMLNNFTYDTCRPQERWESENVLKWVSNIEYIHCKARLEHMDGEEYSGILGINIYLENNVDVFIATNIMPADETTGYFDCTFSIYNRNELIIMDSGWLDTFIPYIINMDEKIKKYYKELNNS